MWPLGPTTWSPKSDGAVRVTCTPAAGGSWTRRGSTAPCGLQAGQPLNRGRSRLDQLLAGHLHMGLRIEESDDLPIDPPMDRGIQRRPPGLADVDRQLVALDGNPALRVVERDDGDAPANGSLEDV